MQIKRLTSIATLAFSALLAEAAAAQQSAPPSSAPPSGSQSAPAAKPSQTGAASKPAQTPAKKPGATASKAAQAPLVLKTQKDKNSYAIGMFYGNQLHQNGVDLDVIDPAIFARALKDALSGSKALLTPEEQRALLTQLQTDMRAKQQAKMQQLGVANKTAGEAFLAENKTKNGVVTTASGLEYKVLQEGTGPRPTADDTVVCNYRGTLIDGTEFDSSYKHGQPATFPVKGVIKGWTEALQLMPVGSKWQLVLPPDLAYGDRGAGPQIGPNATLVFEVELLSIQPKTEPAKPAAPPAAPQIPPGAKPANPSPPPAAKPL
jgi:FKBP-type peptidyl-prolyl cis-trans isomerase FklB